MTKSQLYKYRAEWGKVRKELRRFKFLPKDADAMRMEIHRRAGAVLCDGTPKSSTTLTNLQFSRILGIFWTYTRPADFAAQMHAENQLGIQCRWTARHILELINEASPGSYEPANFDPYIDALFKRLNKDYRRDPDWAEGPEGERAWWRVQAALTYRYDQVVRARLGRAGEVDHDKKRNHARKRVEFDPCKHHDHMQKIRSMHRIPDPIQQPEPEPAYTGPVGDDPF